MTGFLTVTTPSTKAANQLTSIASMQAVLGLASLTSTQTSFLTLLIAQASALMAKHCGRVFAIESLTEIFRTGPETGLSPFNTQVLPYGTPTDSQRRGLILSRYPVATMVSVSDVNGLLDPTADYQVQMAAGIIDRLFGNSIGAWATAPITVVYTAGIDTINNLPSDLESVCISMVTAAWFAQGRDPNVLLDTLDRDRTQFAPTGLSTMEIDPGITAQLAPYVQRAY